MLIIGIDIDGVIGDSDSYFRKNMGEASKHEVAANRGYLFNFFIEDHPEYALDMARNGTRVLLMSYPWNQLIPYHPNIMRVHSWKQIKMLVSEDLCEV